MSSRHGQMSRGAPSDVPRAMSPERRRIAILTGSLAEDAAEVDVLTDLE